MTTNTEARIAKLARRTAKLICQLEREGHLEAARKLEAAACEEVERMRAAAT